MNIMLGQNLLIFFFTDAQNYSNQLRQLYTIVLRITHTHNSTSIYS